jgi:effector-binding domain-containing protein
MASDSGRRRAKGAPSTRQEKAMIEPPRIVQTTAIPIACIHFTIPRAEMMKVMGPGIGELMSTLAAQGISPGGPVLCHHLKMSPATFDFELGVPVGRPVTPSGRVKPGQLPATTVARTVYHGPYQGLPGAWGEFEAWIAAQGRISGPSLWEVYLTDPQQNPDPATWRTELNRPLAR